MSAGSINQKRPHVLQWHRSTFWPGTALALGSIVFLIEASEAAGTGHGLPCLLNGIATIVLADNAASMTLNRASRSSVSD